MDDTQLAKLQRIVIWVIGCVVAAGAVAMAVFYFVLPSLTVTPAIAPEPAVVTPSTSEVTREHALNNYLQATASTTAPALTPAEQYAQDQARAKAANAAIQQAASTNSSTDTGAADRQAALDAYMKAQQSSQ